VPDEPVPLAEALAADYEPFEVGQAWGRPWSTTWLRVTGQIPQDWAGKRVEAVFDPGFVGSWPGGQAEGLAYDLDGVPLKAINPQNQYIPIATEAKGGEHVGLLIELASNPDILGGGFVPTPLGDKRTAADQPLYVFRRADLAVRDENVFHFVLDLEVLGELMRQLPTDSPRRYEILRAIERALDAVDLDDVSASAADARSELAPALAKPAHASAHTIYGAGHAHIDSAWLWPIRETQRKTGRTFANVTMLAKEYPELVFACSQAQQYAWVKERYPLVFQRIVEAVQVGQWAPVGGMWVEADGNLPGGEALARQLVHGKRFFAQEFDVECDGVWLPDSFGYTAAYPQLARLADMHWFLTQKISWNQTNKFPHHTFWWEGIDGSRVFTHFPPVDTYNATFTGDEMAHAVRNYQEKGRGTRSLAPFGHGDGGGGPTREMLEKARRLADLEGSPKVVIAHPDEFFTSALEEYPDAPVWSGELYLELHRATYTSQSKTKQGNRRSEHLLREAELWAAQAQLTTGLEVPYDELDALWKTVLLNQFHDILPGSSIAWVHREAEATYAAVRESLTQIIERSVRAIAPAGPIALNAGPFERTEVVAVPPEFSTQQRSDGAGLALLRVPASGAVTVAVGLVSPAAPVTAGGSSESGFVLDNGLVRVQIDAQGLLSSVIDLQADRELLARGQLGNLLQLHPDFPNQWDAWDIDAHYRNKHTDLTDVQSLVLIEAGPLEASVRVVRSFGRSQVTQTVTVHADSSWVELEVDIDWHEVEKILKVAFPIDLRADVTAAEIQFGHVKRPLHVNTSWEAARFEMCMHRFVLLTEPGYGVAVANDSTYGYDANRTTREDGGTTSTVRLSLVRAPRVPDPQADQGAHRMRYALVPGADVTEAARAGYALNLPVRVVEAAHDAARRLPPPLVRIDGDGVLVESVKLADDRSGDLVLRLYEHRGGRAYVTVRTGVDVLAAQITDLLERPGRDVPSAGPVPLRPDGGIELAFRPFQVVTLRLQVAG
jgi:alpha-mannosidase